MRAVPSLLLGHNVQLQGHPVQGRDYLTSWGCLYATSIFATCYCTTQPPTDHHMTPVCLSSMSETTSINLLSIRGSLVHTCAGQAVLNEHLVVDHTITAVLHDLLLGALLDG